MEPGPRIVIVGGGVLGCAIAWQLARHGARNIALLERGAPGAGSTSQAAGLLTRIRSPDGHVRLATATREAIAELQRALGDRLDLRRTGGVHVAASWASAAALDELCGRADRHGERWHHLSQAELARLLPWLRTDRVHRAVLMPDEAFVDPHRLTDGYARAAVMAGVELRTGVRVTGIATAGGRVTGIETAAGTVRCDVAVLACGVWTNLLTAPLGVLLPYAPVRSQYWITTPAPDFPPRMPFAILPDAGAYARPELGALLFGVRDDESPTLDPRDLPDAVDALPWPYDRDGLATLEARAPALIDLCPRLADAGIAFHVSGPSGYTIDGELAVGHLPGVEGLLVAAGCNGAGIALSGGVGRLVAELALGCEPFMDPAPFAPARCGAIDAFAEDFRRACSRTRALKRSG
ncbi:MAG: FAD-binding oxidoreductase [Planctomycetes bacterium]|nr:FAD-binding oxidoreductase [Planctomycetota bacterium]